ncbi:MAG: hypothetical protein H6511_05230 [Holophagales bacterium]|nr:hypothetical protein [Holophagales bacterium]
MEMSRGQMMDLLGKFAAANPRYREALLADPKSVVERQFNLRLTGVTVRAIEESADSFFVILPRAAGSGELDDSDLEKVAGGGDINVKLGGEVSCQQGALQTMIQINLG